MDKVTLVARMYALANEAAQSDDPKVRLCASVLLSLRAAFCSGYVDFRPLIENLPEDFSESARKWRRIEAGIPTEAPSR